ncbi:hypothetical protein [Kitasatospora purpeofusca]|uniref:hypothetical protein n=1 Tax=Kitasatospora purpeofusca TaxID=67352 RepID=UPI003F4AF589
MIVSRRVAAWVATVSAAAVLVGCSDAGSGDEALPGASGPPTKVPASTATPTGPTTSAAAPSPSGPYYPTLAAGCHDNTAWQDKDRSLWLRLLANRDVDSGGVRLAGADPSHFGGPLCVPERVHIQYWLVHRRTGSLVSLESVSDNDFRTTGLEVQQFPIPKAVTARNRACDGMLLAVYTGEPLKESELPRTFSAVDAIGGELFPNKRVSLEGYVGPTGTATCI